LHGSRWRIQKLLTFLQIFCMFLIMKTLTSRFRLSRRLSLLLGGLLGTALLAFTAAVSLGAFTATITNNANSAASGTIVLSETGTSTCYSTATDAISSNSNTCANNLLGNLTNAVPGVAGTPTTVAFENLGSVNSSTWTVAAGACVTEDNSATTPYYGTDTGQAFTLSSALTTGSPITSLPVTSLSFSVASGDALTLVSGGNSQVFTATATAAINATTVTVASETPNFAYPTSSTGTDITQGFCGKVDFSIYNSTTNYCVFPAGAGACPALSSGATLASLTAHTTPVSVVASGGLAATTTNSLTFSAELDASATNADQGLAANIPLTWELSQ
jgi:hypothetical protein